MEEHLRQEIGLLFARTTVSAADDPDNRPDGRKVGG
jgi:hypothetical protein